MNCIFDLLKINDIEIMESALDSMIEIIKHNF